MIAAWLALLLGCSVGRPSCEAPDQVLATQGSETLTCGEADPMLAWIRLLAARPIGKQEPAALSGLAARFAEDPAGTRAWLADLGSRAAALERERDLTAAELRSHALWEALAGKGPIGPDDGEVWGALESAAAVWNRHDGDELALAEADIEAWIRYASLCREAQGAGALRISVADRVGIYATVGERWDTGTRMDRVALTALGPYWEHVTLRWSASTAEEQQAWIHSAPMPPPMTATSLGYLEAILQGDLIGHAAALHGQLGPLRMRP